jgi:hypothetical protein
MKIELMEDNGLFFGGIPSLIMCACTFDDGRVVRFPYEAGKTIAGLYKDLAGMNKGEKVLTPITLFKPQADPLPITIQAIQRDMTKIEKGDTVTCVFLTNRNDHMGKPATEDLAVGGKYRVTKVLPGGYEVLDDAAPMKFKLFLARNEVELAEKGKPAMKKVTAKEVDLVCPECNETVYCADVKGIYTGKCECGKIVSQSKAIWDKEHPIKAVA